MGDRLLEIAGSELIEKCEQRAVAIQWIFATDNRLEPG